MLKHLFILTILSLLSLSCQHYAFLEEQAPSSDVRSSTFRAQLEEVGKANFKENNAIHSFPHGDAYFTQLLQDIRTAKKSIYLETFIIREGPLATYLIDTLVKKSQEGLEVKLTFDAIGSQNLGKDLIKKLKAANIPVQWHNLWWKNPLVTNQRDHRKIIVIDQKIAYTGGAGIFDIWAGTSDHPQSWKDTYFKVKGPVVNDLYLAFLDNWKKASASELQLLTARLPKQPNIGNLAVQSIISDNGKYSGTVEDAYLLAIKSAKKEITCSMAYVCPPRRIVKAIEAALKRGVKVTVLTASIHTDTAITRSCAHNLWYKLLKKGVDVYEYQPTMLHSKIMVVDRHLTMIGASNLDYRSLRINEENNLHVLDSAFAESTLKDIANDLKKSKQLTVKTLDPFHLGAYIFRSQL